jgi:hypothetical protein
VKYVRRRHWFCTLDDLGARLCGWTEWVVHARGKPVQDLPDSRREYVLSLQTGVWHDSAHCDLSQTKFNQEIRVRLYVRTAQTFTGPLSVALTKACLSVHAHTLNRSGRMLNCSFFGAHS